jgi:hypothetical protein
MEQPIKLMTIIAIVVIIVILNVIFVSNANISYGINGVTETRCINGMKFVVGQSGSVQQILGPNGGGVPCQ